MSELDSWGRSQDEREEEAQARRLNARVRSARLAEANLLDLLRVFQRTSDCCGVGPHNDEGICPQCKEHCEWMGEDEEEKQ